MRLVLENMGQKLWPSCTSLLFTNHPLLNFDTNIIINNNNNLLIYSALFNIPGDQKRITTINNLKLYKY